MRFLVTNDDSIESVFLHELVRALRAAGHELFVAAPKREQSWVGAGKSRHRPVQVEAVAPGGPAPWHQFGCPTWIVDGTPSDAVNIALAHLLPAGTPLDGVVSGINIGLNASLGFIIASGTIAGAWEGALHGFPAVALSHDITTELYNELKAAGGTPQPELQASVRAAAEHAARLIPQFVTATPRRSFTVHNLNFPLPCRSTTEMRETIPARVVIPGLFGPAADDGTHRFVFRLGEEVVEPGPLTDRAAVAAGFISHTVLDYRKLGT